MDILRRLVLLILLAWLPASYAGGLSEEQVKAAYVFNFIKFAEWPLGATGDDGEVRLCVAGAELLGEALHELEGRKAGEQRLRVVRYGSDDGLDGCHVVFIGESLGQRGLVILKSLEDAPVLVISDMDNIAERGGDIGLLLRDNRMQFEVNLASLRRKKLQLPAQVLNLAVNVFGR